MGRSPHACSPLSQEPSPILNKQQISLLLLGLEEILKSFALLVFHPNCDRRLVSLGRIEFAVFSKPSEDQIKTRVNGDYFWGRHFYFQTYFPPL